MMNDIEKCLSVLKQVEPYKGYVPRGYAVDFLGTLTDANFRTMWGVDPAGEGGCYAVAQEPVISWGKALFEAYDWIESAREARDRYVMITLGACYGSQAVGAYLALQRLNPLPAKLVAIEPDPENFEWLQKHFRDNGINPREHWLIQSALSDTNRPVLFPVGSPGSGANHCLFTNQRETRMNYARQFMAGPDIATRVHNLVVNGDTGIETNLAAGWDFPARIKFVSAVTLADVLGPFDRVDLLESDIQQSEEIVFPPAMDKIKAKVKRVHISTHGDPVHQALLEALATRHFEIVFNYAPQTHHDTPWGSFEVNDGLISARNLDL
jgi:FkbM family methyltransferase